VIGWLLDTNVIAALINPNGAPSVKRWAAGQDEDRFFISILTLGEYDKVSKTCRRKTKTDTDTLPPVTRSKTGSVDGPFPSAIRSSGGGAPYPEG